MQKKAIMDREQFIKALIASRQALKETATIPNRKDEAEGGCGVIGMAASVPIPGHHLLPALQQMRNRGNGKGGGIAAVGLDHDFFGVQPAVLANDYLLAVAYLNSVVRPQVESAFVDPTFIVDSVVQLPISPGLRSVPGLQIQPPEVWCYFVRVRPDIQTYFRQQYGITDESSSAVEDEIVSQNTYRLNHAFYDAFGPKQAFALSHGKNLLVLKVIGYGDDVVRAYQLENLRAHVWIGHHRYPTKGNVWHPGGAHPFTGMHEALVHNGDFANYVSICAYLAQRNLYPLFLTDTEVAALVFDLLYRIYGYPLEYVVEAMAPTTERDFALLPAEKQRVYRLLQAVHLHGSPDGPWFFLIAQSDVRKQVYRLIGISDTSMLRPQVFALQQGAATVGFAASEKQAIDAALGSLAREDSRFWSQADLYWTARGGSHTDGGVFIFTVHANECGKATLQCIDKFGHVKMPDVTKQPLSDHRASGGFLIHHEVSPHTLVRRGLSPSDLFNQLCQWLPRWNYNDVCSFLESLELTTGNDDDRDHAIMVLTLLMDRRYPTGTMKRSCLLSLLDQGLARVVDSIRDAPSHRYVWAGFGRSLPEPKEANVNLILDARDYPSEGDEALARAIVTLYQRGFRHFIVVNTHGQRFIGCGLGPASNGLWIDVYGTPGDYLASGIDGAEIIIHGMAQDQLAQIMKGGKLVVYGDVGQTFMYAAKGGQAFIMGNAAGRPLINAAGQPHVVINGTCLDYLAESFMAGDPLHSGGFVIVNGIWFNEDGTIHEMDTPYPGGNLFSLASGGAIYIRDPQHQVTDDQLNGGEFTPLTAQDWDLIRPYLEENELLFGIPLKHLLTVEGCLQPPGWVYRKIRPVRQKVLMPEEAWVRRASDGKLTGQ